LKLSKMDTEFELSNRRPLWRASAGPQATGKVERVLPSDSSQEANGVDARLAAEKAKSRSENKGRGQRCRGQGHFHCGGNGWRGSITDDRFA